jgi:hypothetical protein
MADRSTERRCVRNYADSLGSVSRAIVLAVMATLRGSEGTAGNESAIVNDDEFAGVKGGSRNGEDH